MSVTAAYIGALGVVGAGIVALFTARLTSRSSPYRDMGERLDKAYSRMDDLDVEIGNLKADRRADRERIGHLEDDQWTLIEALAEQHVWQLKGLPPPPPQIPSSALDLLRRHRAGSRDRADEDAR